jgi:DNA polymerase III sliding clamp (beta) subunit (PCNA family)
MPKVSRKNLAKKIKDCRHLVSSKKVISCLEELFFSTNDGLVAYELGHEFEKTGKIQDAAEYYERAETLFKQPIYKNMARAAINNLSIEVLLAAKKKKTRK